MGNRKNQYNPDIVSPPGDTLWEILEEKGMTQKELSGRMNRPEKTINEIVNAKTTITPETAIQLEMVLGTPATFWIQREAKYQESKARERELARLQESIDWLKTLPLNQMIKYNWVRKFTNKIEQLQELLKFFGVASVESWKSIWYNNEPKAAYRMSLAFTSENAAIAAWLRHGEVIALKNELPVYDERKFKTNLYEIRKLTIQKSQIYKSEIKKLCNESGVNVVFTPIIAKAIISGAVRWVGNRPLIQLSLRGKYNDKFWFTFFHEAAHILLHSKKEVFIEGLENYIPELDKELEADDFAANFLIPKELLRIFINTGDRSPNAIMRFAKEIGVHSGIVIGQLQNAKFVAYSHFNDMKRILDIEMD